MGQGQHKGGLDGVIARAEDRVGRINITGRYHKHPRKLTDDYTPLSKVLGSGYNGQVHLAESKANKEKYAVKGFKLHGVTREKKEELESEAEIFLAMDHPHVARLVDVYESKETLDLVMECMTGGELFKRVSEKTKFSEKDAADASWQMLLAVNYIHSQGIVHRDIKLENFLYDKPNGNYLKLIDFGFSKIWAPNTKMALSCGTLAYVAPEVLDMNYTSQCDLWSLGVTVFILLFGYMPFGGPEQKQVSAIKDGKYVVKKEIWSRASADAKDFVKSLLVVNPDVRLTAEAALKHPWIASRDQAMNPDHISQDTANSLVEFGKVSAFRRVCMSMMSWSLTNDERMQVREAFMEMDTDRTGVITLAEFKKVVEDKFHISDDEALQAFHALDTNNTDEVHYTDFLAAMVSSRIQLHDNLLKATFQRFDKDNSGFITADNLREILGQGEDVDKLIAEADSSHDGKISYEEWMNYIKNPSAQDHHQEIASTVIDKAQPTDNKLKAKNENTSKAKGTEEPPKEKEKKPACCHVL